LGWGFAPSWNKGYLLLSEGEKYRKEKGKTLRAGRGGGEDERGWEGNGGKCRMYL